VVRETRPRVVVRLTQTLVVGVSSRASTPRQTSKKNIQTTYLPDNGYSYLPANSPMQRTHYAAIYFDIDSYLSKQSPARGVQELQMYRKSSRCIKNKWKAFSPCKSMRSTRDAQQPPPTALDAPGDQNHCSLRAYRLAPSGIIFSTSPQLLQLYVSKRGFPFFKERHFQLELTLGWERVSVSQGIHVRRT
jgi:hypothetical protein